MLWWLPQGENDPRMCVDCKKLHDVTKINATLLPIIEDNFDLVAGAKNFTSLNLCKGFDKSRWLQGHRKDRFCYYTLRIVHLDSYSVRLEDAPATSQAF